MIKHTTMLHPKNEDLELIVYYDSESLRIENVTDFDSQDVNLEISDERLLKEELEADSL